MLRGNYPATVDGKGRVKVPSAFLAALRATGDEFYVTSENGDHVRVYPMRVWNEIEEKLARLSSHNQTKQKFLMRTSYFGQAVQLDGQGRLLIPPVLREAAEMRGEVDVLGRLNYLEVWNHQRFMDSLKSNPITPDDWKILDDLGI